jgi:hypothetical protein
MANIFSKLFSFRSEVTTLEVAEANTKTARISDIIPSYTFPKLNNEERDQNDLTLKRLKNEIKILQNKRSSLLPVEQEYISKLTGMIREKEIKCHQIEDERKLKEYRKLDINILKILGGKSGHPRFAPFPIDSSKFSTEYPSTWVGTQGWKTYELMSFMKDLYRPLLKEVSERVIHLSVDFKGIIPKEIKDKLPAWQGEFKEVFFIADVTDRWEEKPSLIDYDPLVVGWTGYDFYLLATFDLTPFEKWAAAEMIS